ncbi:hypothetical protein, partial [Streptomyces sp. NPDC059371]|uniref:hypothetical protein n=1 Tax=Streptomyces sp. NPDC059371 TaxID=3346812 RepID=UPI0036B45233
VEGFLLLQAQYEAAQREAQRFTERMPWLTTAQQEEVIRQYVQERRHLTRLTLTAVAWRSHRLREEYEARYALLRARLLKLSALTVCTALLWTACLTAWVCWSPGD